MYFAYKGPKPTGLTTEDIIRYADESIARFSEMIDSGSPMVRVDECEAYLLTWTAVKQNPQWENLSFIARGEVMDCWTEENEDSSDDYPEEVDLNIN